MKKTIVSMFLAGMLLLPTLSFSGSIESVPLEFEFMGVKIYTLDDTLPKEYSSISLLAADGKYFDSLLRDISEETRKMKGNALIILSVEKVGQEYFVFAKVIKTK